MKIVQTLDDGFIINFYNSQSGKMSPDFNFNENDFDTYLTHHYNLFH